MADFPVDLPTMPCSFCDGIGTMRESKGYRSRKVDEDEFTNRTAIIGERCPLCQGRGEMVFTGHGPLNS